MPRGKKLTSAQARGIALGKLAGKSQAQISAETGASRSTVTHANAEIKSLMRSAAERGREKLEAAYVEMVDQLHRDQRAPVYADRADAAARLERAMAVSDHCLGLSGQTMGASADGPVPLLELLRHSYVQTDRVILERETSTKVHVNGNGAKRDG